MFAYEWRSVELLIYAFLCSFVASSNNFLPVIAAQLLANRSKVDTDENRVCDAFVNKEAVVSDKGKEAKAEFIIAKGENSDSGINCSNLEGSSLKDIWMWLLLLWIIKVIAKKKSSRSSGLPLFGSYREQESKGRTSKT